MVINAVSEIKILNCSNWLDFTCQLILLFDTDYVVAAGEEREQFCCDNAGEVGHNCDDRNF